MPGRSEARQGDLTQGPILRTLVMFAIPMLFSNAMHALNGSINAIWVGRLIGENALAATTTANIVMALLFAAIFGFGLAMTVRVGQHFGARDIDAARRAFGSGIGFCSILAVTIGALGWIFSPALLNLLSTPEGSIDQALAYMRVIFITMPFSTVSLTIGMGLRGSGDSQTSFYSICLMLFLDIVLNPLLIRGLGPVPGLGIAGSALASGLAGLGGLLLVLYRIYRRDLPLRLRGAELRYLKPRRDELSHMLGKGLPMGGQLLLVASAQLVVIGLVNREGVDSTAAYGASIQLWNYLQMPAIAISSTLSAMVAQNIGAGLHDRVRAITRVGMLCNLALTGILAGLLTVFAGPLLALFLGNDSTALPVARHIQHIVPWSFIIMGAMVVLNGTLRSYGIVILPMILQAIALYPVRLGFYFGTYPLIGSDALWWSFPVGSAVSMVLIWRLYTRGRWRQRLVQTCAG